MSGQLLYIVENEYLFAVIGVTYGGNAMTNFALPNFIGKEPIEGTRYIIATREILPFMLGSNEAALSEEKGAAPTERWYRTRSLTLSHNSEYEKPVTEVEWQVARIWQGELRVSPVGRDDNFST